MTADTYSSNLGYLVMGTGNDNNAWGTNANASVFQILEDAITVKLTSSVTGGTLDLSASPPPAAASSARYAFLEFTGVLASNQIVQVPNIGKAWWVSNGTSGAFTLKFKTSSGSASVAIPQGAGWTLVRCSGSDTISVFPYSQTIILMPDGTAAAPPYSFANATNSGWYRAGTQDIRLSIAGSDVLQITGTGASSPSIVNVLSPNVLQVAGVTVTATGLVPAGTELDYAGHTEPSGYLFEYGQAISRTTYATLLAAITKTCTGNTNSSTAITGLSEDLRNLGLVGAYIEGTGIPTGTTITAIGSATALTLSQAATATASGISFRILPYGQGNASTTFNVPDRRGRVTAGRDDMGGTSADRLTAVTGSLNGDNLNATGGAETVTVLQANLPSVTLTTTVTVNSNTTGISGVLASSAFVTSASGAGAITLQQGGVGAGITITDGGHTHTASGTTPLGGSGTALANVQPTGIANKIIKY